MCGFGINWFYSFQSLSWPQNTTLTIFPFPQKRVMPCLLENIKATPKMPEWGANSFLHAGWNSLLCKGHPPKNQVGLKQGIGHVLTVRIVMNFIHTVDACATFPICFPTSLIEYHFNSEFRFPVWLALGNHVLTLRS